MPTTTTQLHAETARLELPEIVRRLVTHLGPTMVAVLAGSRDRKAPYRWMKAEDGATPRDDAQARLLLAYRVWRVIADAESDHVARAWFVGANPRLGEVQPFMAIREDKFPEVTAAAQAFVDGTDD